MRATLLIDETGKFPEGNGPLALAGALVPVDAIWGDGAFVRALYASAIPSLLGPVHAITSFHPVSVAVLALLGRFSGSPAHRPPWVTLLTAAAANTLDNSSAGKATEYPSLARLVSEVAHWSNAKTREAVLTELGRGLGSAPTQTPPRPGDTLRPLENWWLADASRSAALERVLGAWNTNREPTLADLQHLTPAMSACPLAVVDAYASAHALANRLRAQYSRANRCVFGQRGVRRVIWVAAAHRTNVAPADGLATIGALADAPAFAAAAGRWIGLFRPFLQRTDQIARRAGISDIDLWILLPNFVAKYSKSIGESPFRWLDSQISRTVAGLDLRCNFNLIRIANNDQVGRLPQLMIADVAAHAAGRSLFRHGPNAREVPWRTAKIRLDQDGIGCSETPSGACATGLPHAAATYRQVNGLPTAPVELRPWEPWMDEQAAAWEREQS